MDSTGIFPYLAEMPRVPRGQCHLPGKLASFGLAMKLNREKADVKVKLETIGIGQKKDVDHDVFSKLTNSGFTRFVGYIYY
jgi:hypothetical protein